MTSQGYLAHKKHPPPPKDHHRALITSLLRGPREGLFLMSEAPLYKVTRLGPRCVSHAAPADWLMCGKLARQRKGVDTLTPRCSSSEAREVLSTLFLSQLQEECRHPLLGVQPPPLPSPSHSRRAAFVPGPPRAPRTGVPHKNPPPIGPPGPPAPATSAAPTGNITNTHHPRSRDRLSASRYPQEPRPSRWWYAYKKTHPP